MADLQRLWAPWRSRFLLRPRQRSCFFCAAKRSRQDRRHHVIARGQAVFALLNRYPYNNGHVMVAPYRHVSSLRVIRQAEWLDMLRMTQWLTDRLRYSLHPQGFNVGVNIGRTAGAGVPGHLHLHIVPRWDGDTNFLPVLGQTKVVSQSLDELYTLLKAPIKVRR